MDDFGIVYIVENAQQFWSEVEEMLRFPPDPTLAALDSALNRFVTFCASYHEQYLQSPLQIDHACELILQSELGLWHWERMCLNLLSLACKNTDPHLQLMIEHILLATGRRHPNFLRAQDRWHPLIPLLMDAARSELYDGLTDPYGRGAPIEAKLRLLAIQLLYEVSRSQKLSMQDLRIFDDNFISHLFDLVEETRDLDDDDMFNNAIIKLLVALNEQFMVLTMPEAANFKASAVASPSNVSSESHNRVLRILIHRTNTGQCQTFAENLIFMLNRASNRSTEDRCMQVLVLKLLYLLFTTPATLEFFYTNDLCVLVDVFLRELLDLDESSESLRHTFLRVLHPLLTRTQLHVYPYKRPQVVRALESLVANSGIRDVDPTTARLVSRCLAADWCVPLMGLSAGGGVSPTTAFGLDGPAGTPRPDVSRLGRRPSHRRAPSTAHRLKPSRSAEALTRPKAAPAPAAEVTAPAPAPAPAGRRQPPAPPRPLAALRAQLPNDSTSSLSGGVGGAFAVDVEPAPVTAARRPAHLTVRLRADSTDLLETSLGLESHARSGGVTPGADYSPRDADVDGLTRAVDGILSLSAGPVAEPAPMLPPEESGMSGAKPRRKAPPAPPAKQRRKPPPAPSRLQGSPSVDALSMSSRSPLQSWGTVGSV